MTHLSQALKFSRPAGLLALALLLLQACGGGGGSTSAAPPAPAGPAANIAGIWTYTGGNGTVYHTLILPEPFDFRSLDSNMVEAVGLMTLSGNTLGGSITAYPPATIPNYPIMTGTVTGTATATLVNDTVTFPLGAATTPLTPDAPANAAVQLADLAGTYAADPLHASSGLAGSLTVHADGSFTLADALGTGQGALTQVAPDLNAFTTTLTFTPTAGSAASFTGHSFLLPGPSPALVVMTNHATGQISGIFTRQ